MFVCNIKFNKLKIVKLILIIVIIISIILLIFYLVKSSKRDVVKDEVTMPEIAEILPENYTNILKSSHENIDLYIGKKIKFSGFVYRLYDFSENQFVLAREMLVDVSQASNTAQVVVVGFLCNCKSTSSFTDGTWVEIEGTITKGYYHSELPVLDITNIQKTNCPDNPYVCPPSDGYVVTESI